jgi:hypothetical protein
MCDQVSYISLGPVSTIPMTPTSGLTCLPSSLLSSRNGTSQLLVCGCAASNLWNEWSRFRHQELSRIHGCVNLFVAVLVLENY